MSEKIILERFNGLFVSVIQEKATAINKKKYDQLIKELEALNKDDKKVLDVIAMLKRSRDLGESFDDVINKKVIFEIVESLRKG